MSLDIERIKADFPILSQQVHGKRLVYLDNGATTQKPKKVIDTLKKFYEEEYATVHRGAYYLSEKSTNAFERVRSRMADFLGASSDTEIVFVRGTTDAINLVASSYGRAFLSEGDEVLISAMEHHSNIIPWQMLRDDKGIELKVIPMNEKGEIIMSEYEKLLSPKTKFISVTYVSNALGTVNPIKEICAKAKAVGALTLVDGAQSAPHMKVNVLDIGCDFYALSGHKIYGPSGVGVLYGCYEHLHKMPPYQGGGSMISNVTFEESTYALPPKRFEAGTPSIAQVVGLGAAIDYMESIGLDEIANHEQEVLDYAHERIQEVKGVRVIGQAENKAGVLSFALDSAHPHDIATILDQEGVAIRAGHHCAQPVMDFYEVPATSRASLAIYNTKDDIDALIAALNKVNEIF